MTFSLNYIWIETDKRPLDTFDPKECGSMRHDLSDNIAAVAAAFPDVHVNLWLDICGIGNHSELISTLESVFPRGNIQLRLLEEVPAYSSMPLFSKTQADFGTEDEKEFLVWKQVDVARLLVVDHLLARGDVAAVYSDADLILSDARRQLATAQTTLSREGCVVGLQKCFSGPIGVENQFLGFDQRQRTVLAQLIEDTLGTIDISEDNGYEAFWEFFQNKSLVRYGLSLDRIGVVMQSLEDEWLEAEHKGFSLD